MARTPLDSNSQRELLYLLRVEVGRAMTGDTRAAKRVDALVARNPRSWRATYVAYNLGPRKFRWLWARVASTHASALPRPGDAPESRSLADLVPGVTP
jgi:hypothetical protein